MNVGHWHWFCPVYHVNLVLIIGPRESIRPALFDLMVDADAEPVAVAFEQDDSVTARFVGRDHNGAAIAAIWVQASADVATVAHEAFHAVVWVLGLKGLRLSDASDEAYAYYLGWLIREIEQRAV